MTFINNNNNNNNNTISALAVLTIKIWGAVFPKPLRLYSSLTLGILVVGPRCRPLATSAPIRPLLANPNLFRNPNMVFESIPTSVRLPPNRCSQWHQSGRYLDRNEMLLIDSSTGPSNPPHATTLIRPYSTACTVYCVLF